MGSKNKRNNITNTLSQFSKKNKCCIIINSNNQNNKDINDYQTILDFYSNLYNNIIVETETILKDFEENSIVEFINTYDLNSLIELNIKLKKLEKSILNISDNNTNYTTLNNYIAYISKVINNFQFIINYIIDYNQKSSCCSILQTLESIQEYVDNTFNNNSTLVSAITSTITIEINEPYKTYIERYGTTTNFDTYLLAEISMELGLDEDNNEPTDNNEAIDNNQINSIEDLNRLFGF